MSDYNVISTTSKYTITVDNMSFESVASAPYAVEIGVVGPQGPRGPQQLVSTRLATTGTPYTLNGGTPNTLDGVSLAIGDLILVKDQSTQSQNGIYSVTFVGSGSNGTWVRSPNFNTSASFANSILVVVGDGTDNIGTQWILPIDPDNPPTLGTDSLIFVPAGGISLPLTIGQGGTNETSQTSNGVAFYNGTSITTDGYFQYNGSQANFNLADSWGGLHILGRSSGEASIALHPDNISNGSAGQWILATNGSNLNNPNDFALYNAPLSSFPFMVQQSTNYVGIGTNNPGYQLDINGTLHASGDVTLDGTIVSGAWNGSAIDVAYGGTGLDSSGPDGNLLTSSGGVWVSSVPVGGSSSAITNGNQPQTIPGPVINANGYIQNFPLPTYSTIGPITYYSPTTYNSQPNCICVGPDGNIWFTEFGSNNIAKMNPVTGECTEYSVPTPDSNLVYICTGPDGNIWFCESNNGGKIGKVTTSGSFTEYSAGITTPQGICSGPDGNLWFCGESTIGKITISGSVTRYTTSGTNLTDICMGSDGNLWVTDFGSGNQILKITTSGDVTYYAVPTPSAQPGALCVGPDGNIWFCESSSGINQIAKLIISTGEIIEYSGLVGGTEPLDICSGPDGNLWAVGGGVGATAGQIIKITTEGVITSFKVANSSTSELADICASGDGNLWITDFGNGNGGLINVVQLVNNSGSRGYSGPVITLAGSVSGNLFYTMPEQGMSYKKVVITLNAYDDAGETITFPVAFSQVAAVTANTTGTSIATISTTSITIPAMSTKTGVIIVEGY